MRWVSFSVVLGSVVIACSAPSIEGDSLAGTQSDTPERNHSGAADSGPSTPAPPQFPVTVAVTGNGSITSSPAGITCTTTTCTGSFAQGTSVTLTAVPASGASFTSWGGACAGANGCLVKTDAAVNVTASFGGAFDGIWSGAYTNTRAANGCTFNNAGTLSTTITLTAGAFASMASVDGCEIRQGAPSCGLVSKANGTAPSSPATLATDTLTGTWKMDLGQFGMLDFPFSAKIVGGKLTGSWTCSGCTGSFSLTKAP